MQFSAFSITRPAANHKIMLHGAGIAILQSPVGRLYVAISSAMNGYPVDT